MARCNSSARPVLPITRVGSVSPPGKWAATASYPETDSALTRNCSVCESPVGVPRMPIARTPSSRIDAVATITGRRATPAAIRCHAPVVTVSESPGCGTNGQNSRTPHSASSGGSTSNENNAATTRPVAACTPRLRVLGAEANNSVSRASTTVALLATIAGPAVRTAVCSAARWSRDLRNSSRYREISSSA